MRSGLSTPAIIFRRRSTAMALQGSMNLPARGCGQVGPLTEHVSEVVRMGRAVSVGRHQLPALGVHCSATFTTSNVKLPATHLSSSSLALQQLALSSGVNSASLCSPPVQ